MTQVAVKVKAAARLHLGLFDLGRATPRTFGGIGFMIENPSSLVRARRSSVTEIDAIGLRDDTRDYLTAIVHRLLREHTAGPVKINIEFRGVEHVGLGSKTALSLAVLTAACAARSISVSKRQLQRHCGRGGASGIGINGFFTGGFLADAGHKGQLPLLPSARQTPSSPSTIILRLDPPPEWHVAMFLPNGLQIFGDDEVAFFRRVTPIPEIEVYEQIALAYHVLIPAIIEDDLDEFGAGLDRFSAIGMKGREISNQPETVRRAISALRKYAPCVGMSSMGPLVFAISRQPLSDTLTDLPPETQYLGTTTFAREGHTVTYG